LIGIGILEQDWGVAEKTAGARGPEDFAARGSSGDKGNGQGDGVFRRRETARPLLNSMKNFNKIYFIS
jgi:hypothetical protein